MNLVLNGRWLPESRIDLGPINLGGERLTRKRKAGAEEDY
jgi:hypothetical protein